MRTCQSCRRQVAQEGDGATRAKDPRRPVGQVSVATDLGPPGHDVRVAVDPVGLRERVDQSSIFSSGVQGGVSCDVPC